MSAFTVQTTIMLNIQHPTLTKECIHEAFLNSQEVKLHSFALQACVQEEALLTGILWS